MDSSVTRLRRWIASVVSGEGFVRKRRVSPKTSIYASSEGRPVEGYVGPLTLSLILGTIGRTDDLKGLFDYGDLLECRIDGFEPLSNPVIE